MSDAYDGIILGAGHNGLVLQAYLARAGLKTLSLDRRDVAGGGLATIEWPAESGFFHNTHSFYHRGLTVLPWYRDLELKRHGAEYIEPELNVAMIGRDGRVLEWWKNFEQTVESFARFSRRDAQTLRKWCDAFDPIVRNILVPEAQSPPLPFERRRALLQRSAEGRLLLETSALSPLEFVRREFEHPMIQAGLLFFNGLREVDLRCRGFGHHIPALLASGRMAQMCVGGSKRLADALVGAIKEAGGEVRLETSPRRLVIESNKTIGVETAEGDFIQARQFIASSLNPQQTFLELIDPSQLPVELADRARDFQYNLIAPLFSLNVNLAEAPHYLAASSHPELEGAFMIIAGLDDPAQFDEIVRCHEAGVIPPTVVWGSCPTRFDPSQAPPGRHSAFIWEKLPYRLQGEARRWDLVKDEHAKQLLSFWKRYAPNVESAMLEWFAASPLDVERAFPNMRGGDLLVGAFANGQIGADRPFPGAGQYRARNFDGLYLCGSCCHPGGNITGLPGYNCAQVILRDLGIPAPWAPPCIESRLGLAALRTE